MVQLIEGMSKLLKKEGITQDTRRQIVVLFEEITPASDTVNRFQKDMIAYVDNIRQALPDCENIICCSDVIESYFGKYKYRGKKAATQGITKDILVLSNYNGKITPQNVCAAMETVTWKQIQLWAGEKLAPSFAKTKRDFWRKVAS